MPIERLGSTLKIICGVAAVLLLILAAPSFGDGVPPTEYWQDNTPLLIWIMVLLLGALSLSFGLIGWFIVREFLKNDREHDILFTSRNEHDKNLTELNTENRLRRVEDK